MAGHQINVSVIIFVIIITIVSINKLLTLGISLISFRIFSKIVDNVTTGSVLRLFEDFFGF